MRIAFLLPLTILTQRSQAKNIFNHAVKSLSYAWLLTSRAERQISEQLDVPAVYILLWFFPTSNKQTNNNKTTKYMVLEKHNRSSLHWKQNRNLTAALQLLNSLHTSCTGLYRGSTAWMWKCNDMQLPISGKGSKRSCGVHGMLSQP